jgi:hypothetical protein
MTYTMMYTRGTGTIGCFLPNRTIYAMVGPNFQPGMLHRVPPICNALKKKAAALGVEVKSGPTVGEVQEGFARISCTLRAVGSQETLGKSELKRVWGNDDAAFEVSDKPVTGFSFAQCKDAVCRDWTPDITHSWGKTWANAGRRSVTYGTGSMTTYKYGGKTVSVKPMPAIMLALMEQVMKATGKSYNWVHVVYYPDGNCKLDWHADDEKTIAKGSTIVGFTLYENPTYIRPIEIKRKPEPKVKPVHKKRKAPADVTVQTSDCAKKTCIQSGPIFSTEIKRKPEPKVKPVHKKRKAPADVTVQTSDCAKKPCISHNTFDL